MVADKLNPAWQVERRDGRGKNKGWPYVVPSCGMYCNLLFCKNE